MLFSILQRDDDALGHQFRRQSHERILRALKQANGNRKVAAELLGIGRTTLYSKLEEYGLKYKFQQS